MSETFRDLALEALDRMMEENGEALAKLAASDYEPFESDEPFQIKLDPETQKLVDEL